jgi:hypothetical protein
VPGAAFVVSSHPDQEAEDRLAAREFFAAALYMALVLLAALVAVPTERLPSDAAVVGLLIGSATGLMLAHWLAFRLAANVTGEAGFAAKSAAREAAAQIGGGLAVAVPAALPFLFLDGKAALTGRARGACGAACPDGSGDSSVAGSVVGCQPRRSGDRARGGGSCRRAESRPWALRAVAPRCVRSVDHSRYSATTPRDLTPTAASLPGTERPLPPRIACQAP